MTSYECEDCEVIVEIEIIEAALGHNEAYESNLCKSCFDKRYK